MKVLVGAAALILTTPLMLLMGVTVLIAPGGTGAAACLYGPAADEAGSDASADTVTGVAAGGGQAGSGLRLGALPVVHATPGSPYTGRVTTAVANLPTGSRGAGSLPTVPGSLRAMTAHAPDFIALNEMSKASRRLLTKSAPGYGAYKDPIGDPSKGTVSANSLGNVVMWNAQTWELVDGGRFKYVEHDLVVFKGNRVDWNRYAIWTVLKNRHDGRQIVVIATHHMTNPQQQKQTHGNYQWPSRIAQYENGMTLLRQLIAKLSTYGPVLLGGDMNVFPSQGAWSAPDQMAEAGYRYTRDQAVIYQFFPTNAALLGKRLVPVSSDHPHALITTLRLGTPNTAAGTVAEPEAPDTLPVALPVNQLPVIGGFTPEQVRNAASIIAAGTRLGVPRRGITIGLMTAYGESRLRNVDHGDRDSIGLFQQRDNGAWGTTTDRMTPDTAATNFFKALLKVAGWRQMKPTLAAHAVQANAVPGHYEPFWPLAKRLYAALRGVALPTSLPTGCNPPTGLVAVGTGEVGFTASGITYVGPFPPAELMARAQRFVAARTYDPYFQTVNGSWYRQCQHFAANLSGRSYSGYASAAVAWKHFVATGAAHPATAADGHAPPIGAWLYYKGSSPDGHVTVYLGNGLAATTDLPVKGAIGIVPVSAPTTEWNQTYLGWAAPWAEPGTGSTSDSASGDGSG